jgi:hypothetical protein
MFHIQHPAQTLIAFAAWIGGFSFGLLAAAVRHWKYFQTAKHPIHVVGEIDPQDAVLFSIGVLLFFNICSLILLRESSKGAIPNFSKRAWRILFVYTYGLGLAGGLWFYFGTNAEWFPGL